jgi:hypothetical protein
VAIDSTKIVRAVMEGSRIRESKGIIPLFGVYLSLFSVQYYNRLSCQFVETIGPQRKTEAQDLLIKAAQQYGYTAFHGIRNSWEWDNIVQPMIERKEDQIMGFTAVALAFGWGDLKVVELIADEKLVIRASDSYEASGYVKDHGLGASAKCYLLRGVTGAFMDLVYGRDYPKGCFSFTAMEPLCRAKGDVCCEFIAQKSSD